MSRPRCRRWIAAHAGIPAYGQEVGRLPADVRRVIEDLTPCRGGAEHEWDTENAAFMRTIDLPVDRFFLRECWRCHLTTRNPAYIPSAQREQGTR